MTMLHNFLPAFRSMCIIGGHTFSLWRQCATVIKVCMHARMAISHDSKVEIVTVPIPDSPQKGGSKGEAVVKSCWLTVRCCEYGNIAL